jgi:hypothetical protein
VEPTSSMSAHYNLVVQTSNLSIVINPLPVLSAIQTLTLISDLPLQAVSDQAGSSNTKIDSTNHDAIGGITVEINVQCCSAIFLIDRTKLRQRWF